MTFCQKTRFGTLGLSLTKEVQTGLLILGYLISKCAKIAIYLKKNTLHLRL